MDQSTEHPAVNHSADKKRLLRLVLWIGLTIVVVLGAIFGGYFIWERASRVSAADLQQVVQRDGIPFDLGSIPDEIVDHLASNRVVLVGEVHFLREHRELMAQLLPKLHARGFRQILVEWTQAADWLLTDFVNDGGLEPAWVPPAGNFAADIAVTIRDFNRTLPDSDHLQIHTIDVNLDEYGGGQSFVNALSALAKHLPDSSLLTAFFESEYDTEDRQETRVQGLLDSLIAHGPELAASWGQYWYDAVLEMVEVERASIPIRALRDSDYDESVRLREEAIKSMTEARLRDYTGGTVINMGSTHAQKEGLRGTDIEWLGDYLVHKSPATEGSITVVDVSAAHIVSTPGSGSPDSDLRASPKNELFRVMNSSLPDRLMFLPVDDPLFEQGRVPVNFEGTIVVGGPKLQYDAFLLLPVAHRVPMTP